MAYSPYGSFAELLRKAQNQSQLRGVSLSKKDVNQAGSGYFSEALDATNAQRSYDLAQASQTLAEKTQAAEENQFTKNYEQSASQFGQNLAEQKRQAEEEKKAAESATTLGYLGTGTTAALAGGLLLKGGGATSTGATAGAGAPGVASTGASVGSVSPGFSAGSVGGAATIAGGVLGGLATKNYAKRQTGSGEIEKYVQESAQHPVAAVLNPNQPIVDTGIVGKGTLVEQALNVPAKVEEEAVGWLQDRLGLSSCIIVTSCTSTDSPEVDITREYRDKFLNTEQLRGYYIIAEKIVPLINKYRFLKKFIKRILVDNLVEYGKYHLGKTPIFPSMDSILISRGFLKMCEYVGKKRERFTRINGEVV